MSKIENPSAFPVHSCELHPDWQGMTLRDWFAGQALAGLLASGTFSNSGEGFEDFIAAKAGTIADAMLLERLYRATQKSEGGE